MSAPMSEDRLVEIENDHCPIIQPNHGCSCVSCAIGELIAEVRRLQKLAAAERALRMAERKSIEMARRYGLGSGEEESAAHDQCDARNAIVAAGGEP